jgi:putative ABC transport system permease protein
MFWNNLKIAWRDLKNQPGLSLINIIGLSIGMACFTLFLIYALHEFSYDQFHHDHSQIFRVYRWTKSYGDRTESKDVYLPMPLGKALEQDFPDVETSIRFREDWGDEFVRIDGQVGRKGMAYADPEFFDVFDFSIIYGNKKAPLANVDDIILTESTAVELFGESNPTGKTMEIQIDDDFVPFKIAAIVADLPSYSTIQFNMLASFDFLENRTNNGKQSRDNWNRSSYWVFVKMKQGSNLAHSAERLQAMRTQYYPEEARRFREEQLWEEDGSPITFGMQSIASMHTDPTIGGSAADPKKIWMLLMLAFGVLLIACINFTTLAIGRSAGRAKEVGIRKVIGSQRNQLIAQFLTEAFFVASLSMLIGIVISQWLFPSFRNLTGIDMHVSLFDFPGIFILLFGVTLLCGLITGSYPSMVLSSFKPVEVLKNQIKLGGSNYFMKSLIICQFAISISLIIATLVIISQVHFLRSAYPGFEKENVVVVDARGTQTLKNYPIFQDQLSRNPHIIGVASSELSIGPEAGWSRSGWKYHNELKEVYEYFIDEHYLDVLGIQLLSGRNFDGAMATDTAASVIVNQSMAHYFGWTEDNVIGQKLSGYHGNSALGDPVVIGLVKDFNFRPLSEEVQPQMFHQFSEYEPQQYFVKIAAGDPSPILAEIEKVWKSIEPAYPFKYSFLEGDIDRFYQSEARFSRIISWAGGISIFLACLGLLGLSALASHNRKKEVGVRKVLGAGLWRIVLLLSKEFLQLVGVAMIIAIPVGWFLMNRWLEGFAYHIDIQWWLLAIAACLALLISFLTISFQNIRSGLKDPIDSLRNE